MIRLFLVIASIFLIGATPDRTVHVVLKPISNHPPEISPYIYGFGVDEQSTDKKSLSHIWELSPPIIRYGGNTSSRFNPKRNTWNNASDWYFTNEKYNGRNFLDSLFNQNTRNGAHTSVTLSLLGWVAKDGHSASYPLQLYPRQRGHFRNAGNGVTLNGKDLIADPTDTSIQVNIDMFKDHIKIMRRKFNKQPHFYILGNEPMLWHQTHRDVHPNPTSYDEYLKKYLDAAIAVRTIDKEAVIIGPALWGWLPIQYSAKDIRSASLGPIKIDRVRHGNIPFLEWFLKKVREKERELNMSLIDVVDVHYYPQNDWLKRDYPNPKIRLDRVKDTRSLWDPTWRDKSWINKKIAFIPNLQKLIKKINPELKLSIGEYNFWGETDISAAIAQAEILGIFGKFGVFSAHYWTVPPKSSPPFMAFKMYRNYNDQKGRFGEIAISNNVGIQPNLSVYSSMAKDASKITVIVINKSLNQPKTVKILATDLLNSLEGSRRIQSIRQYIYSEKTHPEILERSVDLENISIPVAPFSISMIELKITKK